MKTRLLLLCVTLICAVTHPATAQDEDLHLFAVTKDGKCGYIDRTGKIIVPFRFEDLCFDFSKGKASVGLKGKRGFIDKTGRFVIEPIFDRYPSGMFFEGFAEIGVDGKLGYVDHAGRITWLPGYSELGAFSEGLAVVERDYSLQV